MKITGVILSLVLALLCGCRKDIDSTESVRQGVIQYLSGRSGLDISSMEVEVSSVVFRDKEADATVSIRPKGAKDPAASMAMKYTLERKGNQWVVKGKAGVGGANPHGSEGGMPAAPEGGGMPPGHPPVGGNPPASAN